MIKIIAHRVINGNAMTPMFSSLVHRSATINHVAVDQILAPTITPTAFKRGIIPAPTNPKVSNDTKVLLLSIPVMRALTLTAIHHFLV